MQRKKKIMSECILIGLKNNRLHYKCKECNDESYKSINGLNKRFPNTYRFCNGDVNEFVLLLRKGVYPNEYMNRWKKFNEASILDKEVFYSKLNDEDITDEDHAHYKKVFKKFELKVLGEYHNLHVQSDTLLLAGVFENFRDKFIEIYELDPAHFLSAPGLAWQACLKQTRVKLELLTDYDMLKMINVEFVKQYIGMQKQILIIWDKNIMKTFNHHIQNIWVQIICLDGQCLKNYQQKFLNG